MGAALTAEPGTGMEAIANLVQPKVKQLNAMLGAIQYKADADSLGVNDETRASIERARRLAISKYSDCMRTLREDATYAAMSDAQTNQRRMN